MKFSYFNYVYLSPDDQSFQSKAKHVNVNVKENRNQSVQLFSGSDQKTVQGKLEVRILYVPIIYINRNELGKQNLMAMIE